jgi:hypothetical protein
MKTFPLNVHRIKVSPPGRPIDLVPGVAAIVRHEVYDFIPQHGRWHHTWDIFEAQTILYDEVVTGGKRRLQLATITPESRAMILAGEAGQVEDDHWQRDEVDPHEVMIAVQIEGHVYMIDGSHRMRRACEMGWDRIPVFMLTHKEDMSCRICDCCRPT